ncbi:hypothetical protein [Candidatus Formimonas warabiya]|uniref:Uncharacterized protein n=1 Tax=Formimonas warabiya TaxID=1761012 RepID=A0A3G1KMA0_FORW1|nr:hypothetical protein [Candidatus Formimonas warabiya]ATW23578.1 hypothetical protein DCMF_01105 [Candidatus Formimonas warabiya]
MNKKWLVEMMTVVLIVAILASVAFADRALSLGKTAEQEKMPDSLPQVLPDLFRNLAGKFEGIDIPIYLPAYLPGTGPYGVANFIATKNSYSFEVIKVDNSNLSETAKPISMADSVVFISASGTPFAPYPTEEQLFAKPSGTVQLDGTAVNSYENGMEVTWSKGNWEFFAVGQAEQEGFRVAREMMQALPADEDLVPGGIRGKLRVSQLGNSIYVTASWTYDGKIWYILDGRSSPGERMKMLQSVTRLAEQQEAREGYYPRVPEKITTPEMAVQAYFDALYFANNLTLDQMAAVGGTLGMEKEPYPAAYSYWSKEWQGKNSYEQFLASWAGTAHVELLKLLPAGEEKAEKRFFVESKHLEVVGEKLRPGIFYYTGFFTVRETPDGWRITGGELEPENLGWQLGGHQPWRGDAEQVARVLGLGASIDTPLGEAVTIENPDGTVTVRFVDAQGKETGAVTLYKPEDGIWQVIDQ